jgi:DNA-binding transcriptional LysR family regulator
MPPLWAVACAALKRALAPLFEQTREGQQLTDAGEALLVAVEGMALAASAIEPAAGKDVLGRVRISVSEGLGSWIIARHLGAFARAHPGLSIDLVASNGFLNPSRREADLAILLSRPKAGPLVARKLSDYTLQLYAGKVYLAQRPRSSASMTCAPVISSSAISPTCSMRPNSTIWQISLLPSPPPCAPPASSPSIACSPPTRAWACCPLYR